MRKRIEPTIIENTLATVTGFDRAYQKMQQQVALKGQSAKIGGSDHSSPKITQFYK